MVEETEVPEENQRPVAIHWDIDESGVKHHNPNPIHRIMAYSVYTWGNNTQTAYCIFIVSSHFMLGVMVYKKRILFFRFVFSCFLSLMVGLLQSPINF